MADKYFGWSSYNYCLGNPIRLIDPNGMEVDDNAVKDNKAYQDYANSEVGKARLAQFRKGGKYEKYKLTIKIVKLGLVDGLCSNNKEKKTIDISIYSGLNTSDYKESSYLDGVLTFAHEMDHADYFTKKESGKVGAWFLKQMSNKEEAISVQYYLDARIALLKEINQKYNYGKTNKEIIDKAKDYFGFNQSAYDISKKLNPIKN